jgi:hypothetical protein
VGGRFGGYKTGLAVWISKYWLDKGYYFISTAPCVYADDIKDVVPLTDGRIKAVVLFDEPGLQFMINRQVDVVVSYARKMDCVYWFTGFIPPPQRARALTVMPLWNMESSGVPLICYRWRVRVMGSESAGNFFWFGASECWGTFQSGAPEMEREDIYDACIKWTDEYIKRYDKKGYRVPKMEETGALSTLDAAAEIAESADQLQTVFARKRRRS